MAGTALARELTAAPARRARFAVATRADDADLRRLLRENPMRGRISLSLEREPDYFADAELPDEERQTIVAREGGGIVCVGSCAVRQRFVNGRPRRVGYLGGLRLDAGAAGRFDILRRGYRFFRELQSEAPADFYFTSIAADNGRARQYLERGLPGMPRYEFIGDFLTLLLPVPGASNARAGRDCAAGAGADQGVGPSLFAELSREHGCDHQFAPLWSEAQLTALQALGLRAEDFHACSEGGRIAAAATLWDQRGLRQIVIRGYAPGLTLARPALNLIARMTGGPRLPAVGATLATAFVSHLTVAPDRPGALSDLIFKLRAAAAARGLEFLTLGFAGNDPRLAALRRRFRCREYHSRIYVVRWPGLGGAAGELDGRILAPEVALL